MKMQSGPHARYIGARTTSYRFVFESGAKMVVSARTKTEARRVAVDHARPEYGKILKKCGIC